MGTIQHGALPRMCEVKGRTGRHLQPGPPTKLAPRRWRRP